MSNCLRIFLRQPPRGLPAKCYDENGNICLQLSSTSKYSKTKKAETLNRLNKITGEGVLSFKLPATPLNKMILKAYGCFGTIRFSQLTPIPIVVRESSRTLKQDLLCIRSKNIDGSWEVEMIESNTLWKDQLRECKLCELPALIFTYTKQNLQSQWANNNSYSDGGACAWFPLVNYGNWQQPALFDDDGNLLNTTEVSLGDFRPWFYVTGLLKKAFDKIGWCFHSPILETEEFGRRLIAYLHEDCSDKDELNTKCKFKAVVGENYATNGYDGAIGANSFPYDTPGPNITFGDTEFAGSDPDDCFSTGTSIELNADGTMIDYWNFVRGMNESCDFYVQLEVCNNNTFPVRINVGTRTLTYAGNPNVPNVSVLALAHNNQQTHILNPGTCTTIVMSWTEFLNSQQAMGVYLTTTVPAPLQPVTPQPLVEIQAGSFLTNDFDEQTIVEGSEVNVMGCIDCNITALDLFEAITQMLGPGLITTDCINKRVCLYQPNTVTLWSGESVEGFYRDYPVVTGLPIKCDTQSIIFKDDIQDARYVCVGWCTPDDALTKQRGYDGAENQLHGTYLDAGPDYNADQTLEFKNPMFEPFVTAATPELQVGADVGVPIIPHLFDNDERKISCKLKPRIGLTAYTVQRANGAPVQWSCDGDIQFMVPYVYMDNTVDTGIPPLEANLSLADFPGSFYELIWSRRINEVRNSAKFSVEAYIEPCEYDNFDFRNLYALDLAGKTELVKVTELGGIKPCTKDALSLIAQPAYYNEGFACETYKCNNRPRLGYTYDGDCLRLFLDGAISSPINNSFIEWRYAGSTNPWTPYDPTGANGNVTPDALCGCNLCYSFKLEIVCQSLSPGYAEGNDGDNDMWVKFRIVDCFGIPLSSSIPAFIQPSGAGYTSALIQQNTVPPDPWWFGDPDLSTCDSVNPFTGWTNIFYSTLSRFPVGDVRYYTLTVAHPVYGVMQSRVKIKRIGDYKNGGAGQESWIDYEIVDCGSSIHCREIEVRLKVDYDDGCPSYESITAIDLSQDLAPI